VIVAGSRPRTASTGATRWSAKARCGSSATASSSESAMRRNTAARPAEAGVAPGRAASRISPRSSTTSSTKTTSAASPSR